MKTSPTLVLSATDLAIAAAARAGTLRAEHQRSERLGNAFVAISDAVGLIEVALSGEEAARRIREVVEAAGLENGHQYAGQAFARGERGADVGPAAIARTRQGVTDTAEGLHALANVAEREGRMDAARALAEWADSLAPFVP